MLRAVYGYASTAVPIVGVVLPSIMCSRGKYSAGDSERQIDDLDELVAVDDAFAPDGFEIGERLFRDGFLGRVSRGLQFLNAIAGGDEHVPGFREVHFVAERAVPRNNLGVIAGEREDFVGGGDH